MRDRRVAVREVSRALEVERQLDQGGVFGPYSRMAVEHVIDAYEEIPDPVEAAARRVVEAFEDFDTPADSFLEAPGALS